MLCKSCGAYIHNAEYKYCTNCGLPLNSGSARAVELFNETVRAARELGTDLLEMTSHEGTCGICSAHQGRVYSISGYDNRFPRLPAYVLSNGVLHDGCRHSFFPFFYGVSELTNGMDPIIYSNKPFVDERSEHEKEQWELKKETEREAIKDKITYEKIKVLLPDIAPKSFGGFRKMKSSASKNYLLLIERAKNIGIEI